jgi:hypothetical protein
VKPLPGTPSDQVDAVLASGRGEISTLFVSMARRHPEGRDAEYLRWHTLDHRPEQHRLAAVRASLRLVSTPACRAARAAGDERFNAIDHVMTYFFTDQGGLTAFNELSAALGGADRKLPLLPPVQRGVYAVRSKLAAPRVKIGGDVLPWWPACGVYLLLEMGASRPAFLIDIDGVAGVWSATSQSVEASVACPCGADDLLLLPRRRPRPDRGAAAAGTGDPMERRSHRTVIRRTVLPGGAPRMGPLCAVRDGQHANRIDGRLRQGALTCGPAGRAAR